MILFLDVLPYQKLLEYNQTMTCPECGHFGRYEVYLVANRFRLFFIPIFTFGKRYLVKTTCCNTIYQLDFEKGKAIEKGHPTSIVESDLTLYQLGTRETTSHCQNCGYTHEVGANFCPNCGHELK